MYIKAYKNLYRNVYKNLHVFMKNVYKKSKNF